MSLSLPFYFLSRLIQPLVVLFLTSSLISCAQPFQPDPWKNDSMVDGTLSDSLKNHRLDDYLKQFGFDMSDLQFNNWLLGVKFRFADEFIENLSPNHMKILKVFAESASFRHRMFLASLPTKKDRNSIHRIVYSELVDALSKMPNDRHRFKNKEVYFSIYEGAEALFEKVDIAIQPHTFTLGATTVGNLRQNSRIVLKLDSGALRDNSLRDLSMFSANYSDDLIVLLPETTFVTMSKKKSDKEGVTWVTAQVTEGFDCRFR